MGEIKSNSITAQEAINELVGLDTSGMVNQEVTFSYTTDIVGMENGRQVTNQMLQAISDFSAAVLVQANKFPEIAYRIEKMDIDFAERWVN